MLLPIIVFLSFTLWTLFHWQELPELLKNETADERWPLSIHHTATPIRLITVTLVYSAFCFSLLNACVWLFEQLTTDTMAPWYAVVLLASMHFAPYSSRMSAYIRYFFQRHLFFPSLPSHQEDAIVSTLMKQAKNQNCTAREIKHVQKLIKSQFNSTIHAFNLMSLKNERKLVRREFKKIRHKGLLENNELNDIEEQQLRFHLYSCYRLLTRMTLARYWAGRDRRKAFRNLGYTINIGDGDVYSKCRRLKYSVSHYLLHR